MQQIIRSEVSEIRFGLYTDDETKQLSCCKVTSPVAFDGLGNPLSSGLYDPRMGPISQHVGPCKTCDLIYMNCPGHPGHIELCVPVYQPLLFANMFQLLRAQCANCHKFRLSHSKIRSTILKLKLLEMGDIEACEGFDDMIQPPVIFEENEAETTIEIENKLMNIENKYNEYSKQQKSNIYQRSSTTSKSQMAKYTSSFVKGLRREIIDSFLKSLIACKRCDSCGAFSPPLRQDSYTKIFERPLQKRLRKSMEGMKIKLKTALESIESSGKSVTNDSDDDDGGIDEGSEGGEDAEDALQSPITEADKYIAPIEVEARMKLLWNFHYDVLGLIWNHSLISVTKSSVSNIKNAWQLFFLRCILVPPSRFRPPSDMGVLKSEHPQQTNLTKVITSNESIMRLLAQTRGFSPETLTDEIIPSDKNISSIVTLWIELQYHVNCFMDSSKDTKAYVPNTSGIRQILERKEGLFRKNMMGKRVNYCCRSVISPDPNIGTNEIGIPVIFAQTLHYAVPVTPWNVQFLRQLVENGPSIYPGANQIETPDGKIVKLDKFTLQERIAKSKLLLSTPGMKVYRHLMNGDVLLVNRQPTLHKPGVMAHKARVFKHVKEKTLRMNYANCNSYNADFDGDEMNCHFVQNELARAEANIICNTDNQYIVPTSGNPLRGLIQDHVASGVKLTCKNTFLDKEEFQQLLYIAVTGLPGTEISTDKEDMIMPPPTILKPKQLWTGKQVITALLAHMCRPPLPPLHLDGKTRTPPTSFGVSQMEHVIIFRFGELLSGVLDKSSIGNSSLGIVHAVYELYGAELAGRILNAFGRLFTYYLQYTGHSCGIEDLILTTAADNERKNLLKKTEDTAEIGLFAYANGYNVSDILNSRKNAITNQERMDCRNKIARMLISDKREGKIKLDSAMQSVVNKSASEVIKACLPVGLACPFPKNNFSMMVLTGAKGSAVNQSQISGLLGQQALEGQRVPMMISGKTLPSFAPYDTRARAGGFVADRFLTGVKPQEYYFHCMAGREGLVDTAVKTSRSGYLQRCLIKHLEELKVSYDMSVRDSGGNVIQFLYGEDGLDPTMAALLKGNDSHMQFLARNHQALVYKHSIHNDFFKQGLDMENSQNYHNNMSKAKKLVNKLCHSSSEVIEDKCDSCHMIFKKNSIILARKKINASRPWSRKNMYKSWFPANILKVHKPDNDLRNFVYYDVIYTDTNVKEKRIPAYMKIKSKFNTSNNIEYGLNTNNCSDNMVPLLKIGLPDTIMSKLPLDTSIGAISENLQDKIISYITNNPDKIISNITSETCVSAEGLQLLVWIKYMRSLACPGEAVGCVAAQSIGEPSTQMTLNTFHLAGHGGANVTLGIPRLREIIMTASKTLKTPTMLIPLHKNYDMNAAKKLALKLSRVSLRDLTHNEKAVEVNERILRVNNNWCRMYRIRFNFQDSTKILKAFSIKFSDLQNTIKNEFLVKLRHIIQLEQRRAKNTATIAAKSTNDNLLAFRAPSGSSRGDYEPSSGGRNNDEDNNSDNDNNDDIDSSKKGKKKDGADVGVDSESEDDDEKDDMEQGTLRLGGKDEIVGYEDDIEDSDESVSNSGDSELTDGDSESESTDNDKEDLIQLNKRKKSSKNSSASVSHIVSVGAGKINVDDMKISVSQSWIEIEMSLPALSRRLLMVQLVEQALDKTHVKVTKDIKNAYAIQTEVNGEERCAVQTEGVNFEAAWSLSSTLADYSNIMSNDIYKVLCTFGVEAARKCIVSEMQGVFGVYGIDVNPRHLSLIADFMTRTGSYVAMNRNGMAECPSPFLQMSFETTCAFLTKAAFDGSIDTLESPSARIVTGSVPRVGTGCFELMLPLTSSA